ncbi:hypothetical protein CRV24_007017 [Beauveria bassiana]|nr:hypothetical protein CRV24_007017 [Beauveria bassiana]KAH8712816.1 hypothetical protein HC256_005992 [Beauveria bassiana]
MAGSSSQKQGHTTADGSADSVACYKTPNRAATTAQAQSPASTRGQHAQEQAVPDDQDSGSEWFTTEESGQDSSGGARSRRQSSDAISQSVFLSDTNAEKNSAQHRAPSFGEEMSSNASWVMQQFWADQGIVPIWARPMQASDGAANAHGRARMLPIIADLERYIAPFQ